MVRTVLIRLLFIAEGSPDSPACLDWSRGPVPYPQVVETGHLGPPSFLFRIMREKFSDALLDKVVLPCLEEKE